MGLGIFNRQITSLHAAALIIGAAGFLSRLLGLLRDRLLASHFGAGNTLDAYYAAFQIPDTLFTIFLIGAASAAILPVFIEYREHGKDAIRMVQTLLSIFSVVASVIVVILIFLAPLLVPIIVPGFSSEKMRLTITLTRIMMISPLFFGIAGIISSTLQSYHHFLIYSLPAIFYNIAIIFGIIVLVPIMGPEGLAAGVILGALAQIFVQLPMFFTLGFRPKFIFNTRDEGVRRIFKISIPRVAALSFNQLTLLLFVGIASYLAAGSVSIFKFAANLIYFPIGLFGVSYAVAIFPKLSENVMRNKGKEFISELSFGIRNIVFWSLPLVFLFIVLRAHIVRVILGAGLFDWNNTRLVAATLAVLSIMIIFEGLNTLLIRAFYALGKTREPLRANLIASFVSICIALAITVLLRIEPSSLKALSAILRIADVGDTRVVAIATAFSLGSFLNFILLSSILRKSVFRVFGITPLRNFYPIFRITIASLFAGIIAYITLIPFPAIISTRTFLGIAAQGVTAGLTGFAGYFLVLGLLRSDEFLSLVESFRQKLYSVKKQPEIFEVEKLDGKESGK
ncbi:MAG: murein biosynthesis integral membrane protein MurJ [bacterium]|nr:murein biosynthesis integral membrane protein MurJ [bacterium]